MDNRDSVTVTDQIMHEQALGIGLSNECYTWNEAKVMAEQRNLDWDEVVGWSKLTGGIYEFHYSLRCA